MDRQLDLKEIALIGRTFDEYYRIFDLDNNLLNNETILDAASGVSSFCAEANEKGYNVTASDRIYAAKPEDIELKCIQDLGSIIEQMPSISDMYIWDYFSDINALKVQREKAYRSFIEDFREHGTGRYVPAEFPFTGFCNDQFTLSLVSHFLFLYEDCLDYEFHKKTISELLRITSKEIRIFPVANMKGRRSSFLEPLMSDLEELEIKIQKVRYEFMRNVNEMLVIRIMK